MLIIVLLEPCELGIEFSAVQMNTWRSREVS